MKEEITIKFEKQHRGNWLKIYIPPTEHNHLNNVVLQNEDGQTIRSLQISNGVSAVDVTNILNESIDIKIETTYEIVLKNIKLSNE